MTDVSYSAGFAAGRVTGIAEERLACEQVCWDTKTARGDLTDAAWAIRARGAQPAPAALEATECPFCDVMASRCPTHGKSAAVAECTCEPLRKDARIQALELEVHCLRTLIDPDGNGKARPLVFAAIDAAQRSGLSEGKDVA